ncbi:sarcomere length short isoform X2 [Arctopsyche grandis]|uniref:sarcomere length short isoform X2 n=1 Tax=Arctopsyche grandis TaxID=121162 RepID=UPI00406D8A40
MPGRPPWVRESGSSAPQQPPAWTLRKRSSIPVEPEPSSTKGIEEQLASAKASLKKQTTTTAARPKNENGVNNNDDDDTERPLVKPSSLREKKVEANGGSKVKTTTTPKKVSVQESSKDKKEETNGDAKAKSPAKKTVVEEAPPEKLPPKKPPLAKQPSKDEMAKKPPMLQRQTSKEDGGKKWRDPLLEKVKENIDKTIANEIPKGHTLTKNESLRSLLKPVPPPMPPPMPPKLPPPPEFKKPPPTVEKIKKIESLKSRPRKRPDWSDMMKEVESGRKLKHVVCNDRSSPIIKVSMVKAKGQYVYESEKGDNKVNQLLKQINQGVKLKSVKTNDRSKPNLDGLRKFRRQLTIEEQIQKSQSQANLAEVPEAAPEEEDVDEMDDIDRVRDDLQSTKQLLALELRNKEAQQRENKRLLQRIGNLENELKSERAHVKQEQAKTVISVVDAYDETLVSSLKREVTETKRVADDLEKKYHRAAEELDDTQSELEEIKRKNAELEKKLEQALKGIVHSSTQGSRRPSHAQRQQSIQKSSSEEEIDESSGEEGEDEEEKVKRKMGKEVKLLVNKIRNLKNKKDMARKERVGLKLQLRNQQKALKIEKKKYKALKKEVDKMASLMKETDEDEDDDEEKSEDEEDDEEKKGEEEASEEEETETESEEETESETESESEPEDAPVEKKKENFTVRAKKHETSLSALKKGNYLIIANVDRLKDDVNKQREMSANLQEDLDSVLAELE